VVVVTAKLNSTAVPGSALAIEWFGARTGVGVEAGDMEAHGGWHCSVLMQRDVVIF
jgi:hypothetical protein